MKLYVTYGYGTNLRNCYSVVEGDTVSECYDKVVAGTSGKYACTYHEDQYADCIGKYGLREVPLQAQEMLK